MTAIDEPAQRDDWDALLDSDALFDDDHPTAETDVADELDTLFGTAPATVDPDTHAALPPAFRKPSATPAATCPDTAAPPSRRERRTRKRAATTTDTKQGSRRDYGDTTRRQKRASAAERAERKLAGAVERRRKYAQLRLCGTLGHITRTESEMTAWFVQRVVPWSMRSLHRQQQAIEDEALVLVRLRNIGVDRLHRRTVRSVWPVTVWAANHDAWAEPPANVPGTLGWADYLLGQQRALLRSEGALPTVKHRYWGVVLPERSKLAAAIEKSAQLLEGAGWVGQIAGRWADGIFKREVDELDELLHELDLVMAGKGVAAQRATGAELDYLLLRSASVGMPLPAVGIGDRAGKPDWERDDIAALVDATEVTYEPGDGYTTVSGVVHGRRHTAAVIVLTVGRMGGLDIPKKMLPWMVLGDALGEPLEWSERINLWSKELAHRKLKFQMNRIESQWRHYTVEHDETPPDELKMQHARVRDALKEVEHDHTGLANRVEAWIRVAVVGRDPKDVREKVARLKDMYEPSIELHEEDGQYQLLREFVPGEPQANVAHRRRMSVATLSSGMAAVGDRIGDRTGILLGETASISPRPVAWNPYYGPEVLGKSGFTPIVAVPGSGKSHLAAMAVYQSVRAGAYGVIFDPSGPLARMAKIPELAPYTRVYELTKNAEPGSLNLYQVIADPDPDAPQYQPGHPDFTGDADPAASSHSRYAADVRAVRAVRIQEAVTVLLGMLPIALRCNSKCATVIQRAASSVGGEAHHHLGEVLDAIAAIAAAAGVSDEVGAVAADVYETLTLMRDLPEARVLFPPEGELGRRISATDQRVRLTILTMPGLQLPDGATDEEQWTPAMRMAGPLMHVAAWQANSLVYDRPVRERKICLLDEDKFLNRTTTGRTLNLRFAVDSRKYNLRVLVLSQTPSTFIGLDDGDDDKSALSYEVFIGDLGGDDDAIAQALKLAKLPVGQGYEAVFKSISSSGEATFDEDVNGQQVHAERAREFLVRMADDMEVVRVDWSNFTHLEHVLAAIDSSPRAGGRGWTG